jgi:Putative neutral zinc metallopeptidase
LSSSSRHFYIETLSGLFDFNRAPFFQSFMEGQTCPHKAVIPTAACSPKTLTEKLHTTVETRRNFRTHDRTRTALRSQLHWRGAAPSIASPLRNVHRKLSKQMPSAPSEANQVQVRVELQAECLAGVWAHHSQQSQGYVVPDAFTRGFQNVEHRGAGNNQRGDFPRLAAGLCITSFLADQQKKRSGSYQKGKQNTDDDRNNPMPTIRRLAPFRSSSFLRRSDAQPEKKVVAHRPIPRRLFKWTSSTKPGAPSSARLCSGLMSMVATVIAKRVAAA